jgi:prepilin-type N-terminal cleavage/methylation domain-containing protein
MSDHVLRRGVTMIEVMLALVLVSTILLVSLTASANLLRNHAGQRNMVNGQALANQILDEVSAMNFQDIANPVFGLESGELGANRSLFDDVDDYQGYSMSPPTYRDGTVITGYSGWTVSVAVVAADPHAAGIETASADGNSPLRRIVVSCTTPDGTIIDATTLVSNVPSDRPNSTSYERWRHAKLTFSGGRQIHVTAPLRNQPATSGGY